MVAIYSALIIYYQPPFGLMDDFKNIEHTKFKPRFFWILHKPIL